MQYAKSLAANMGNNCLEASRKLLLHALGGLYCRMAMAPRVFASDCGLYHSRPTAAADLLVLLLRLQPAAAVLSSSWRLRLQKLVMKAMRGLCFSRARHSNVLLSSILFMLAKWWCASTAAALSHPASASSRYNLKLAHVACESWHR